MMIDMLMPIAFLAPLLVSLSGCRSGDSVVGDDAIRAKPVSVAAAHYFPTGDGKGDETYEVVLRNVGAAPEVQIVLN